MPTRDFPPGILRILRNADSEAKRLGHSRVTPLHLAEAIRRKDDDEAFASDVALNLDAALGNLPIDFSPQVHDDATLDLLREASSKDEPELALRESLVAILSAMSVPAGAAEPETTAVANETALSGDTPEVVASDESGVPVRLRPFVDEVDSASPILPRLAEVHRIIAMTSPLCFWQRKARAEALSRSACPPC